ncbi:MAG: hypothetical protein H6747_15540 [Deltaproteobacteria bacterium]|nr:hypothetical protein [Deltaproteobacteria bacterium]
MDRPRRRTGGLWPTAAVRLLLVLAMAWPMASGAAPIDVSSANVNGLDKVLGIHGTIYGDVEKLVARPAGLPEVVLLPDAMQCFPAAPASGAIWSQCTFDVAIDLHDAPDGKITVTLEASFRGGGSATTAVERFFDSAFLGTLEVPAALELDGDMLTLAATCTHPKNPDPKISVSFDPPHPRGCERCGDGAFSLPSGRGKLDARVFVGRYSDEAITVTFTCEGTKVGRKVLVGPSTQRRVYPVVTNTDAIAAATKTPDGGCSATGGGAARRGLGMVLVVLAALAVLGLRRMSRIRGFRGAAPSLRALLMLLAAVVSGCADDPAADTTPQRPAIDAPVQGPGGAVYQIVSAGRGDANTLPLWPLGPGSPDADVDSNGDFVARVSRSVTASGHRVWDVAANAVDAAPFRLLETDVGLFLARAPRSHFATPLLLLPHEVRVGMQWRARWRYPDPLEGWGDVGICAFRDDHDVWEFTVASVATVPLPAGKGSARVWTIWLHGPDAPWECSTTQSKRFQQIESALVFVEGQGPSRETVDALHLHPDNFWLENDPKYVGSDGFADVSEPPEVRAIVANDAVHTTDVALPVLDLAPIASASPLVEGASVRDVSATLVPGIGLVLRLDGIGDGSFINVGAGPGSNGSLPAVVPGSYAGTYEGCTVWDGDRFAMDDATLTKLDKKCPHALTSFVDAAGMLQRARTGRYGTALEREVTVVEDPFGADLTYYNFVRQGWAMWDGPGGSLRGWLYDGVGGFGARGVGDWGVGYTDGFQAEGAQPTVRMHTSDPFLALTATAYDFGGYAARPLAHGDDGVALLRRGSAGRTLAFARVDGAGKTVALEDLGETGLGGSARYSRADGKELLHTDRVGVVRRVDFDEGGVVITPIARVPLPAGHGMVGVVRGTADELLVFTMTGREWEPSFKSQAGFALHESLHHYGAVYAWRSKLPAAADAGPDVDAALRAITAEGVGELVRVCQGDTGLLPELHDFRVDDEPAIVLLQPGPVEPCTILRAPAGRTDVRAVTVQVGELGSVTRRVRPLGSRPSDRYRGIDAFVYGPFGLGRYARWRTPPSKIADLDGGGVWTDDGPCDPEIPPDQCQAQAPTGCGAAACSRYSYHHGAVHQTFVAPAGMNQPMLGGIFGGGHTLDRAGKVTTIPAVVGGAVVQSVLADGTVCSSKACQRPGGAVVPVDDLCPKVGDGETQTAWCPVGAGSLVSSEHRVFSLPLLAIPPTAAHPEQLAADVRVAILDPVTGHLDVQKLGNLGFEGAVMDPDAWRFRPFYAGGQLFVLAGYWHPDGVMLGVDEPRGHRLLRAVGGKLEVVSGGDDIARLEAEPSDIFAHVEPLTGLIEWVEHHEGGLDAIGGWLMPVPASSYDCATDPLCECSKDADCAVSGGQGACALGRCTAVCAATTADCDGKWQNGCEAALGSDASCGGCGDVCATGTHCKDALCQCPGGGEVGSDAHCSACGDACSGDAHCVQGTCVGPITALAAGGDATLALRDGAVRCWGEALACGVTGDAGVASPAVVPALAGTGAAAVVSMTAGDAHGCAARADGSVWCWGENTFGQAGVAGASTVATATQVVGVTGAVEVAAGEAFSCARTGAGAVFCWGRNLWGETGAGSKGDTKPHPVPVALPAFDDAASLGLGARHGCARRKTSGQLWCWGDHTWGQLGQPLGSTHAPIAMPGFAAPSQAVPGGLSTLLQASDGGWWGTGRHFEYQLPGAAKASQYNTPVALPLLDGALQVALGAASTCWLDGKGVLRCVGANDAGQLGGGDTTQTFGKPVDLSALGPMSLLAVGSQHGCALGVDGALRCWGSGAAVRGVAADTAVAPVLVVVP